jgi:hypothetical protein
VRERTLSRSSEDPQRELERLRREIEQSRRESERLREDKARLEREPRDGDVEGAQEVRVWVEADQLGSLAILYKSAATSVPLRA